MNSEDYVAYIDELMAPLESYYPLRKARFFGGHSFKAKDVQFAMLLQNKLYFCVNDITRPRYVQAGMECFSYEKQGKRIDVTKYYAVPDYLFDEPEGFLEWAREAIDAAGTYPQKRR